MDPYLGKHYKFESDENFQEYLKYIQVFYTYRTLMKYEFPVLSLTRNVDGTYRFELYLRMRAARCTFRLGEEFIEERGDQVKPSALFSQPEAVSEGNGIVIGGAHRILVKSIAHIDGNKFYLTQVEINGRKSSHVCEFTPDTVTMTTTAEGWDGKAVRKFKLVEWIGEQE